MADISELEKQIAKLPVGYIIEKVINDKKYYYQQWKENGKITEALQRAIDEWKKNETDQKMRFEYLDL